MPKNNIYLPKENLAKVEEIREIENKELITSVEQAKVVDKLVKNEIPSYEEFMRTYQEEEGVIDSYYYEVDSHGDIRVVKCHGPGFWDDFLRRVTSVALAVSYVTPLAVVTVPASVGVGVAGAAMATLSDDKDARNVGRQMLGVVGQAAAHHLDGGVSENFDKVKLIADCVIR